MFSSKFRKRYEKKLTGGQKDKKLELEIEERSLFFAVSNRNPSFKVHVK